MAEIPAELKSEVKKLVVETLKIKDVDPETILNEPSLFSGENTITLDSIDAIELIMAVQKTYSVRLDDQNLARSIMNSIDSITAFIVEEQAKNKS
jgi:acyl carrier protein